MSIEIVVNETKPKMESVVKDLQRKLASVRTGRASISLLDSVVVDYYGTPTPLSQMASVGISEPQMLTVQPWDATQIDAIEKAIHIANIGINPSNDGKLIRLPIPPLNEERRQQLAKQINEIAEDHRVAIRGIRQNSNNELKKMLNKKEISEDNEHTGLNEVQKITDKYINKIDEFSRSKEEEILKV